METLLEPPQVYERYRPSGLDWIKDIPTHWELVRMKFLFNEVNERSEKGDEDLLSVSQYTGVTKTIDQVAEGEMITNASTLEGYKKVSEGDLVTNIMLAWNGSLGFSPYSGITSPAYSVYQLSPRHDRRYFHYLLRTEIYKAEFKRMSSGVIDSRLRLYTDDFFKIFAIVPSAEEQTRIAQFLHRKTAQIDKAISQKEKLVELLKERRQILIHNAVTRGLNPNVKMKDSGVEWIGEVPEHWTLKRLKFLCHITTGTRNTEDKVENGKYPFFVRSQTPEKINSYSFDGEAILTAGDGAGVGKVFHYIKGKFDFHQRVYKFSLFREVKGLYLFHYLRENFANVALLGTAKSTVDSLRLPLIQDFEVGYPAETEQKEIVHYIQKIDASIEAASHALVSQIEQLKEYKATLINSAVTGKIKV